MTPAPTLLAAMLEEIPSVILRDQVWDDYYYMRANQICSRCGDYSKHEIIEVRQPIERDLNERYGYDFHTMHYSIKTTRILTKQSLQDSDWGSLCSKCKEHVLGRNYYPLSSSKEDAESELRDMKKNELRRQQQQTDKIKSLRKELNKERRENGGRPAREIVHDQFNPNEA